MSTSKRFHNYVFILFHWRVQDLSGANGTYIVIRILGMLHTSKLAILSAKLQQEVAT